MVAIAVGFFCGASSAVAAPSYVSTPEMARKAQVSVWRPWMASRTTFSTFEDSFMQGGYLATGDVDGDGMDEIVIGSGPGRKNEVRVYESDGKLLKSFQPFAWNYQGGVRVAVGDLDGNGKDEIAVAADSGLEPMVAVFDESGRKLREALAYGKDFRGGVRVAIGDLDRDGKQDVVVAPGSGGGPHIRLLDEKLENKGMDLFAFDASMRDGVSIAIVKTTWGDQLIAGIESLSSPLVRRYSFDQRGGRLDKEFYAFDQASMSGVSIAGYDLDGDGSEEIVTWQNGGTVPEVRVFDMYGTLYKKYLLHDPTYRGSLSMASVRTSEREPVNLATVSVAPMTVNRVDAEKYIVVDISEQRLYAYEYGREVKTFLVSTGVTRHATPIVETIVSEKIPVKRYRWIYAPGSPDNYDLPNVKWNLRVYGPIYIHGAYWHNNFGHRMSHGCINVHYTNAEWVYNWADVGTLVSIRE